MLLASKSNHVIVPTGGTNRQSVGSNQAAIITLRDSHNCNTNSKLHTTQTWKFLKILSFITAMLCQMLATVVCCQHVSFKHKEINRKYSLCWIGFNQCLVSLGLIQRFSGEEILPPLYNRSIGRQRKTNNYCLF